MRQVIQLALISTLLAWATAPRASECLVYENYLHLTGGKNTLNDADQLLDGSDGIAYLITEGGQSTGSFFVSLDISDPSAPETLGWIECELKKPFSLAAYDRYIYCGLGDAYPPGANGNIYIISVFTPSVPWIHSTFPTGSWPLDLLVDGELLCVATYSDGLKIYSLTDPANLAELSSTDLGGSVWSLAELDVYLYVGVDRQGQPALDVMDISDPSMPDSLTSISLPDIPRAMIVYQDHLFVAADEAGLLVFDLTDPANPQSLLPPHGAASSVALDLHGSLLYSAAAASGLQIFDLLDPADPQLLAGLSLHQETWEVLATPSHAILTGTDILSIDVTPPASGEPIAVAALPDYPNDIAVDGHTAYIATRGDGPAAGLLIYDISDPQNLILMDSWASSGEAFNVAVHAGKAYLAHADIVPESDNVLMTVLNVSDPANPQPQGSVSFQGFESRDLQVFGQHVYVIDSMGSLRVLDVSDPDQPAQVGLYQSGALSDPRGLAVDGQRAYVADGQGGLIIFDVSNPSSPQQLGSYSDGGACNDVVQIGNLVYLACAGQGLLVLDVTNPTGVDLVGAVGANVSLELSSLELGWTHVFASYNRGLMVLDVSDPAAPLMGGSLGLPGEGNTDNVLLHGDMILATLGSAGLGFLPLHCGELTATPDATPAASSLGAWPNPFNPHSTLRFRLREAASATLSIHDVSGRHLRTLAAGPLEAGAHEFVWDGRDAAGRDLPSGVYLARLEAGSQRANRKLTLLR